MEYQPVVNVDGRLVSHETLDLVVLGEGVETDALAAIGCDRLQGFYFGRPTSPSISEG